MVANTRYNQSRTALQGTATGSTQHRPFEKLTVAHVTNKFLAVYGARKCITVAINGRGILAWATLIHSTSSRIIYSTSVLILSPIHASSFQVFLPKFWKSISHLSYSCYIFSPSNPLWSYDPNNICWRIQIAKTVNMRYFHSPLL